MPIDLSRDCKQTPAGVLLEQRGTEEASGVFYTYSGTGKPGLFLLEIQVINNKPAHKHPLLQSPTLTG